MCFLQQVRLSFICIRAFPRSYGIRRHVLFMTTIGLETVTRIPVRLFPNMSVPTISVPTQNSTNYRWEQYRQVDSINTNMAWLILLGKQGYTSRQDRPQNKGGEIIKSRLLGDASPWLTSFRGRVSDLTVPRARSHRGLLNYFNGLKTVD